MLLDALGDKELGIFRPSVEAFAEADLLVSEGLAMSRGSVLLVGGTVADMAIQNNEGRAALRLSEDLQGMLDAVNVIGVTDAQDVPPITQEPGRYVYRESDTGVPFDGDVVVVVNPADIVIPFGMQSLSRPAIIGWLRFQRGHFAQPAQVPCGPTELGGQEGLRRITGCQDYLGRPLCDLEGFTIQDSRGLYHPGNGAPEIT